MSRVTFCALITLYIFPNNKTKTKNSINKTMKDLDQEVESIATESGSPNSGTTLDVSPSPAASASVAFSPYPAVSPSVAVPPPVAVPPSVAFFVKPFMPPGASQGDPHVPVLPIPPNQQINVAFDKTR